VLPCKQTNGNRSEAVGFQTSRRIFLSIKVDENELNIKHRRLKTEICLYLKNGIIFNHSILVYMNGAPQYISSQRLDAILSFCSVSGVANWKGMFRAFSSYTIHVFVGVDCWRFALFIYTKKRKKHYFIN